MSTFEMTNDNINKAFLQAMDTPGGHTKVGSMVETWTQKKLRENRLMDTIITVKPITPDKCQREEDNDNLYYMDDLEPEGTAYQINWRGEAPTAFVKVKRIKYYFNTVSSDRLTIYDDTLRATNMPLTKILEQNLIKDMYEQQDRIFFNHIHTMLFLSTVDRYNKLVREGTVTGTSNFGSAAELYRYLFLRSKGGAGVWAPLASVNVANGYYSNILLSTETEWNKYVLKELVNIPAFRQLEGKILLMHKTTYNDVLAWAATDAGFKLVDEITVDGYKYFTFGGYKFVTTLRDNKYLVNPGVIYIFPEEQFFGKMFVLEKLKLWVERKPRMTIMEAYEDLGGGIANPYGLGVILLKGARIPIRVSYQNAVGTVTSTGVQWIINDETLAALPALET